MQGTMDFNSKTLSLRNSLILVPSRLFRLLLEENGSAVKVGLRTDVRRLQGGCGLRTRTEKVMHRMRGSDRRNEGTEGEREIELLRGRKR
jgi:hypothetical protein